MDADALIDDTDWSALSHAYDQAADTPGHLAGLLAEDLAARGDAVRHLWSAVLHQGTIYPVTAPAALAVAAMLTDPRASVPLDGEPLRAALLRFLGEVADSLAHSPLDADLDPDCPAGREEELRALTAGEWDDEPDFSDELFPVMWSRAVLACRAALPALLDAAIAWLDDPDAGRAARFAAVRMAAEACAADTVVDHLAGLAADSRRAPAARAEALLALADLGVDTTGYLADPEQAVRVCAALGSRDGEDEILGGLLALPESDEWLRGSPFLTGRLRFRLVAAAVDRIEDFGRLAPAALHVLGHASVHTVERDWGPLLGRADGEPGREFRAAVADNDRLWDHRDGTVALYLKDLGLPADRAAFRAAVG